MLWINPLFYCLSRLRLLRAAGAEDLRPPLRRHDGLVPHVHHLRHVLHAPRARQGKHERITMPTMTHSDTIQR